MGWSAKDWVDFFDNGFLVVIALLFARFLPRPLNWLMVRVEREMGKFGRRPAVSLVAIFLLSIGIRLAILPILPVPAPQAHDEFSYLLAADTFAHGRLTNPTPVMWKNIESFHMIFTPSYQSQYPPGQGLVLALGQVLGLPWIGVLLSVGLMCATVTWALRGWMSPKWSMIAGVLVVLKYSIAHYWINSYWGGAVPAIGGALVVGGAVRVVKQRSALGAFMMALGAMVLANSRPYEGLVLVLVVGVWVLLRVVRDGWPVATFARQLAVPACFVFVAIGSWMMYYNWRVTGSATTMPYQINIKQYKYARPFLWQHPVAPPEYRSVEFKRYFAWELYGWNETRTTAGTIHLITDRTRVYYERYVYPLLLPFIIGVIWLWRGRKNRVLLAAIAGMWIAVLIESWGPNEHYFAPGLLAVLATVMFGVRYMRLWRMPEGLGLHWSRILLLFLAAQLVQEGAEGISDFYTSAPKWPYQRAALAHELERMPGKHIVIVQYTPDHLFHNEWVFNGGDPDGSKIVWARDLSSADNKALFGYYRDRQIWTIHADEKAPTLQAVDRNQQQELLEGSAAGNAQ